ncbi:ABC transporter G family member 23-like [Diabrotica virgifera virgifera]|uniref:ABC transporter G family member 23-like n=1 Tax=Diabrotica virgifera virgifera TaxID=50390 RepID=A0A6P7FRC8_DIAVI|nr:ABC transporter G family member 23-like [Diabrotica virgifera virgifera]KAI2474061.1 ATP binding cassette (ABC) transporter subfamily H member [Diabrotica virgifera virgifera]
MHDDYAVFVDRVVKKYGQKEVLTGICMKVERGSIYGLLGASGCGKTTLLSSIVGRKKIDGGEIWVLGGKPGEAGSGVPGPRVGYMPQDIALVGEFTVKDAIYYFGRIFSMEDSLIAKRYRNLHTLLELPPDDRYLKNCSGGQQRRVSLAASLVHKPELLIMDEPTVGVDPVLRDRIWKHLVDITKKDNTSVIITTHYIEECRQANKIGLMREGKLLAEESPTRLLTLFNSETLEDVFLLLSKRQEEGRLQELTSHRVVDDQNNSMLANDTTGSTTSVATSVSTFEIGHGSTDILAKKKILKARNALNKSRMKALFDKNLKQFYRNITGIIFLMTFPILQVGVFMGAVGGDIRSIPLGIVNDEAMSVTCPGFSFNGTATATDDRACQLRNISCRFLSYLDHPMIEKVHFETLEDAKDAVLHGKIVGAMYMSSNFTSFLEERIDKGKDIEKDILSLSEIKVWMDMSNRQIGATLKYKLIDLYTKFQNSLFDDCDFVPGFGDLPVNINFIYGDGDEPYTVFMIPGSLITIMFFMGAIMTSQIIITDRHDGVWDRSIVAGVTSLEITITHLVLQASICIIQTAELLVVVYLIYQQEYSGSLWLMYVMVYLQGICGMAYGFWVSVISTDHSMANTVLTGIFLPMMMLSGLMWPTEGMPPALRIFSRCLPFTMAIESLRNVSKRGWSIDNFQVYSGMGVGFMWTVFFGVLSVYLIKKKR